MKRGDLVPVVLAGAYGKPRPALVIQSDLFSKHPSVTILPVTTEIRPIETFRIAVEPSERNGLRAPSQIMVDKAHTIPRDKAGEAFGVLEARTLAAVNRSLAVFLGLG
ncbi:MAG TPA: type II toxin-antitoxin system PemK/MazF family toxin [Terracidiphilus sp.]|nr:type II toxin-antitoxin system PemK/MazF family toxin [Terracidiphilus sp.]